MKLLRTLALALFCACAGFISAQSYDFSTTYGFNTAPNRLVPLTNDRWLAVCTGSATPGSIYKDTVVAVVFNADGEMLFEKRLELPLSEIYSVYSAIGTPDGGFAINVSRDLCDATNQFSLLVFDAAGNLKWSNHSNPAKGHMDITADGNLRVVARSAEKLVVYNLETGAEISSVMMKDPATPYGLIRDFEFIENDHICVAVGSQILQRWDQQADGSYLLVKSKAIEPYLIPELVKYGPLSGQYYTYQSGGFNLYRFNIINLGYNLLATYPFQLNDVKATPTCLVAAAESAGTSFLVKLDFQGAILDTIRIFKETLKGQLLDYRDNTIAVAGLHGSGPGMPFNAKQLWLHTNHLDDVQPVAAVDAAMTNVYQTGLLTVDSTYFDFINAYIYYFSGGKYQIEITNNSTTLLESVDVNIGFETNTLNICPYRPAKTIHYDGLGLLPNESTLVEFSGINAPFQPTKPAQLCFWLSNPNRTPDVAPGNDTYCHSFNTVGASEPEPAAFLVSPNPANSSLRVTFPDAAKTGDWRLFDVLGQQLASGVVEQGSTLLDIPTAELPAGMYSLWVNGVGVKVVVAH